MEQMVITEKPLVTITSFETGSAGRAITMVAGNSKIPTIGLQHGKIHPAHPHYIFTGVSTSKAPNLKYCPIPDKTAVYGEFTKEVLIKYSAYHPENVVVTGQPSSDRTILANEIYEKRNTYQRFGLDSNKKLIVLLSQNFQETEFRERMLTLTVEGMKPFSSIQLIVKLHPGETEELALNLLRKKGFYNVPVTKKIDLFEILSAGDIIVTGNSTVALEAMMFKKPVITIEGFPFSMPYAESGASIGVRDTNEMITAIKSILEEKKTLQELRKNQEKFLLKHVGIVDGKASERIANLIIKLAKNEKR